MKKDNSISHQDQKNLELLVQYRIGAGASWGSYDFWTAVLESITAGIILLPTAIAANVLASKIYDTLKSSRAETDEFQSCRFDILILVRKKSWIELRIMQSAKFRTSRKFSEDDIFKMILDSIDKYNDIFSKNKDKSFLVAAELTNHSDEINLRFYFNMDLTSKKLSDIKKQYKKLKSDKTKFFIIDLK